MQKNKKATKKNVGLKPVFKPYLKGRPVSKTSARRATRVIMYVLMFTVIYVLLGGMMAFDNTFLRVSTNAAVVLLAMSLMYNEGARQGETDVAFGEIAQRRLDEGKVVPDSEKDTCFHPMKGFFTALVGISPILLLSLVFAAIAQKQYYTLGALPDWVSSYSGQAEIHQSLAYYNEIQGLKIADVLRMVVRLLNFPYVNMVGTDNIHSLYLVDKLSPVLCLLAPMFYGLGYLRGPYLRALVHGNIRQNKLRHNKREVKARQARAQQKRPAPKKKELI